MTRRRLFSGLQWACVILALGMIMASFTPLCGLALFLVLTDLRVAIWAGITKTFGMLDRPRPMHFALIYRRLHVQTARTVAAIRVCLTGTLLAWRDAWVLHLVNPGADTFHKLFHFWRHIALHDGAFYPGAPKIHPPQYLGTA